MRRRHVLVSALALLGPVGSTRAASLSPAPLVIRQRILANGLQVVALPDAGDATVAVQVWYRVGGKDDPPGRSGFAHLFEHMMFKSTRHMRAEMFDRLTEDVGGENNAYTSEDVTVYQAQVPSHHLERLLWAEAERMAFLNVDQLNFDSERSVVQEEFRQGVLADPYGRLFNALPRIGFERHPYRNPVIGSIEDLAAATLADVRSFHATYYRPDNAVLVVAGGFDPAQFDAWVDRYFGPLERPAVPVPRVTVREPPRRRDVRVALRAPNVPLPALAVLWKGPPASHADAPALRVASALLSGGESSRLNESLVYRARQAQQAGFEAALNVDAGLLVAYAIAAAGASLPRLERLLLGEIERLARSPLRADELDKVRTKLLTAALERRQKPEGRAAAAGQAIIDHGDAARADLELPALQAVTGADVQRALRRHVLDRRKAVVTYVAGDAAGPR